MFRLGLIINAWNQADYLRRVLRAVAGQSVLPDEVVLADDGSEDDTGKIFSQWAAGQTVAAHHVTQQHQGFRRARILNQAIASAHSDYLVFLDGDTIPHPKFVSDHRRLAQPRVFIQGHRALIEKRAAAWFGLNHFNSDRRRALRQCQIRGLKNAFRWPRPWRRHRPDLHGIRGCNLGIWREHLLQVNGYNEAFVGWGREDSELALRLMNCQVQRVDVRGWALCFHLWHSPAPRTSLEANDELLAQAQHTATTRCAAGLDQHLSIPRQ
jgi:glycosyltransferase involved in cell wall biosynthesis